MNIYTDEFKERTLVRRVFLSKDVSKETLSLLVGLMNEFPSIHLKSPLSMLAGANLSFSTYHFADGYVFEGKITQTQSDAFGFLFVNPYKECESALSQAFEKGYVYSEKNIAVIKEKLVLENEILLRSSSMVSDSIFGAYKSPLILDDKKLMPIKKEEIDALLDLIRKAKSGDYLYFGKKGKNEIYFPVSYSSSLPSLYDFTVVKGEKKTKYLDDESVVLHLSAMKMETISDFYLFDAALVCLKDAIGQYLRKKVSIDFDISFSLIGAADWLFKVTLPKGKACYVNDLLSIKDGKLSLNLDFDMCLLKDAVNERMINENMDSVSYLEDKMLLADLNLKEGEMNIDEEKAKKFLSSIIVKEKDFLGKDSNND